jgi:hypothetical protein
LFHAGASDSAAGGDLPEWRRIIRNAPNTIATAATYGKYSLTRGEVNWSNHDGAATIRVAEGTFASAMAGFVVGTVAVAIAGNRINTRNGASISTTGGVGATTETGTSEVRLRRRGLMVEEGSVIRFTFLWRCGYRRVDFRP